MKKIIFFGILLIGFFFQGKTQVDSAVLTKILDRNNKLIQQAISNQTIELKDTMNVIRTSNKQSIKPNQTIAEILIFLPVILFILMFYAVFRKLKKENIPISLLFIDKDFQISMKSQEMKAIVANSEAQVAQANAIKANSVAFAAAHVAPEMPDNLPVLVPDDKSENFSKEQSVSRFIAFITALVTLALAVCVTSYYFYQGFLGDQINLSGLSTVLLGLGLGIIPYGVSKVASAIQNR